MRVLGLDVGERRVGVALSDDLEVTAQPLTVLERKGGEADVEAIRKLVAKHEVATIVVGLPLAMRGTHSAQAQRAAAFAQRLRAATPAAVTLVDERLTTVQGARALREAGAARKTWKRAIDMVAAQLILQHYLDTQRQP